jgi:hypothetical protein
MMKKLCFCLLSFLSVIPFLLSFVKGDVIDPSRWVLENCEKCDFIKDTNWLQIEWLLTLVSWYIILLLFLLTIFTMFLYKIFEKFWEKWWKALIPFKNLYCLANLLNVKKIGIIWWILAVFRWFFFCTLGYSLSRKILYNDMFHVIAYLPVAIIFFIYDCFILFLFYNLFRKFGWDKLYSVLWTIFFPVWICVLWFGNFQCQWEELDKKGDN